MATKKISELEAINAAEDNDVLVIVDTSESTTNKITKGNLLIGAGHTIEMTLNENYQIVLVLKNAAGTALSTQTIDLPNENAVTNLAYNNGILTVTKQSGATSQINLTGLIEGLVTESDFNTFVTAIKGIIGISTNTYDSTQTYNTGDIVVQSEKIYKANQDNITGTFDSSKWDEISLYEYQKIQDEAIAENYKVINKLNEKLENQQKVIDQLPQVEGQGTEVTLQDTIAAQFTKFDEEGNSEQETTEGYNQLDLEKYTYNESGSTLNGGTVTIKNGVITLDATNATGTVTAVSETRISTADSIEAGTYYFGVDVYGTYESTPSTNIWEYRGNRTLTEKFIIKQWKYAVTQGNIGSTPILISNDTSKKTYEQYTGGIASPNPNYEQPIESAGDNENELQNTATSQTKNGIDFTVYDDGTVEANGTSTGYAVITIGNIELPKGNYILSGCPTGGGNSTFLLRTQNGVNISDIYDTGSGANISITENSGSADIKLQISPNVTVNNLIFKPKLERGNKATPYSPYGMGSITDKIVSKNLLEITENTVLARCTYVSGANTNQYKLLCTAADMYFNEVRNVGISWSIANGNLIPCKQGETLYFNMGNSLFNGCYFTEYDKNLKSLGYSGTNSSSGTYTPTNINCAFVTFRGGYGRNAVPGTTYTLAPIISKTPIDSYVSHKEQTYSIYTQQPMRSIGDVRDCFVKKSDGWYERHYIARYICKGNEVFLNQTELETVSRWIIQMIGAKTGSALSNYYTYYPNYTASTEHFYVSSNQILTFHNKTITSSSQYSQYFAEKYASGNPIYFDYQLATPQDLPCTPEQVEQLENKPNTYKDFTIIQSQDETEAYLEVSGIRDIDTMFDKVTNAIVSLGGNV